MRLLLKKPAALVPLLLLAAVAAWGQTQGSGQGGGGGSAPSGAAGGDLGGTYPNPTVVSGAHLTGTLASGLTIPSPSLTSPSIDGGLITTDGSGHMTFAGSAPQVILGATSTIGSLRIFTGDGNASHLSSIKSTAAQSSAVAFNLPNVSGPVNLISSGDSATVTNAMLAGSIAAAKLVGTDFTNLYASSGGSDEISVFSAAGATGNRLVSLITGFGGFGTGLGLAASSQIEWDSGANLAGGTQDTVISRSAAGVVQFGTTTANALGTINFANMTASGAAVKMTGITTGTNADTVCLKADGTLLIQAAACTISSMRFKNLIGDYKATPLQAIAQLNPIVFTMKEGERPNQDWNYDKPQIGLSAENVSAIEPRCAIYEQDGITPKSYRQECLIAVLVAAVKDQQTELKALKSRLP